ncbi:hypothetical protein OVA14_07155 [Agrococcus sp. SL85]|uniref:hypothetical protein n=1 Tax=Agrococcus sp. SL85 TaxID=2995141 RepID=UPI00226D2636|nr:hypothetical protein [Agrococcus sp. SL85]WAC65170.1 hypothetical protein OVA14_07155 [Agrococcus sp. SL85]
MDSMQRTITCHGGPANGKRYTVHTSAERLDLPVKGGHYSVGEKRATWVPDTPQKRAPQNATPQEQTPTPEQQ